MTRRELLLAATAMTVAPRCLRAQQKAMPVIGFLDIGGPDPANRFQAAFRQGLRACQEIIESTFERVEYRFTTKSAYHIL